jgi:hypothetical protein
LYRNTDAIDAAMQSAIQTGVEYIIRVLKC